LPPVLLLFFIHRIESDQFTVVPDLTINYMGQRGERSKRTTSKISSLGTTCHSEATNGLCLGRSRRKPHLQQTWHSIQMR